MTTPKADAVNNPLLKKIPINCELKHDKNALKVEETIACVN